MNHRATARAVGLAVYLLPLAALAHEDADWIRRDGLKNRMGEYCCGVQDCQAVDPENVKEGPGGYEISGVVGGFELIPYSEPMPFSIDGRLWICRYNTDRLRRRCVFDKPKGF